MWPALAAAPTRLAICHIGAETRAVDRALRKAYGIGLCSVEEIGSFLAAIEAARGKQNKTLRLWLRAPGTARAMASPGYATVSALIGQHQLDPTLVKRYAVDFRGAESLRDARRDRVEAFTNNMPEWAAKDRQGLLCQLNNYARTQEVNS